MVCDRQPELELFYIVHPDDGPYLVTVEGKQQRCASSQI